MLIGARRTGDGGEHYWRITQYLLPFYSMIPPILIDTADSHASPFHSHAWVPIDDEHTWTWSFGSNPHEPFTDENLAYYGGSEGMWGPIDDNYLPLRNKDNDYLIDRDMQRTVNFTGIVGIPNQDGAVQESMGPIVDRSRERLGTSDAAIIAFRKRILRCARDLQRGREPAAAHNGSWYNVRSASIVLEPDVAYHDGAASLLAGAEIKG